MATSKTKATKVLAFNSPTEATSRPRKVLFTWDDTEFTVPHADDISPNVLMDIFEKVDINPIAGMAHLFRSMLADQYDDFKALPLTKDQFEVLSTALMEHVSAAYEKDEGEKGKD